MLLLQMPLTTQTAFALEQPTAFVHPPLQRHDQVDDPPQDPATLDDEVPAEQAYWVALLHAPLTAQAALAIPQDALDPPPLQRHDQDEEPQHEPAENPDGEPAEHVLLDPPQEPLTAQAALAIPQDALDPPPLPRHDQDEEPQHEPAENPDGEPAEHVLLDPPQEPLTEQAAFALEQLKVLVHPPLPRQAQVELHPQDPATLDDELPAEQAYWTLLLQEPFTEQAAFALEQLKVLVHPPLPRQAQVELHPQDPATLDDELPAEQAY
jgi:hypothetical protein